MDSSILTRCRSVVAGIAAGSAMLILCSTAHASVLTLATAGPWKAYAGTASNGTEVCGMETVWGDGRAIDIKRFGNEHYLVIQATDTHWSFDDNDKTVDVSMKIGSNDPWGAKGSVNADPPEGIDIKVPALRILDFLKEFGISDSMILRLGDNNHIWTIDLTGTGTVLKSFSDCLDEMSQ